MADEDIQRYLDRTESQHIIRPKYIAAVTALLEKLDVAHGIAKAIPGYYDVATAVGEQLDTIGEIVGVIRKTIPLYVPNVTEVPDDDLYRTIILSKIIQNNWDGTNEGFYEIWEVTAATLFPVIYHDNQDMSIDVTILGEVDDHIADLIAYGYIIPKPMGVETNTSILVESKPGKEQLYAGTAMYEADIFNLGTVVLPDIDSIVPLVDELDVIMMDEYGVLLME